MNSAHPLGLQSNGCSCALLSGWQSHHNSWNQWLEISQSVGAGLQNNHSNIKLRQILLKRQVAINRNKNAERSCYQSQQLAVLNAAQPIWGTVLISYQQNP